MIKTNFHTHTKRCQHAGGEDIELCIFLILQLWIYGTSY